jgi:hypothetical protein
MNEIYIYLIASKISYMDCWTVIILIPKIYQVISQFFISI